MTSPPHSSSDLLKWWIPTCIAEEELHLTEICTSLDELLGVLIYRKQEPQIICSVLAVFYKRVEYDRGLAEVNLTNRNNHFLAVSSGQMS